MKRFMMAVSLVLLACPRAPEAPSPFALEVERLVRAAGDDLESSSFPVRVSPTCALVAEVDASNKGNGWVVLGNLFIRVLDEHDDGFIYEGGTLRLELLPANEKGVADLVATGIGLVTEDEDDHLVCERRVPIYARFRFDPTRGRFRILKQDSRVFAWLLDD